MILLEREVLEAAHAGTLRWSVWWAQAYVQGPQTRDQPDWVITGVLNRLKSRGLLRIEVPVRGSALIVLTEKGAETWEMIRAAGDVPEERRKSGRHDTPGNPRG